MTLKLICSALLLLCLSCSASHRHGQTTITLGPRYSPLTRIVESPASVIHDGDAFTVGDTVYVRNINIWLVEYPDNSAKQHAFLLHQQVHAVRQSSDPALWLHSYINDPAFRWEEEKKGYGVEIVYLVQHGYWVNSDNFGVVASHVCRGLKDRMVEFVEAKNWSQAVIITSIIVPNQVFTFNDIVNFNFH